MKNQITTGFLGVCLLFSISLAAQEPIQVNQHPVPKPMLFSNVSQKQSCGFNSLHQLFAFKKQDVLSLQLTPDFIFSGQVVDKVQKSASQLSINIRSTNYPGALMSVTLITQPGQKPVITGVIIHPQYGDALMLTRENDQYFLVKKFQQTFMTE